MADTMTLEQVRSNMRDAMNSVLKDDTRRIVVDWYNAIEAAIKQREHDKRDAARYRWLRDSADSYTWDYLGGIGADRVDAAVDAAMVKESGR